MKRAVIGIGSPFAGDRAGWLVVDRLQPLEGVDCLKLDRPGPALLQQMEGYQQVILVDAVLSSGPDEVMVLDRPALESLAQPAISSHAAGVAEAIALGSALGNLPPQLYLVGVGIVDPQKEPPSQWFEKAARKIEDLLQC